ncbi:transposase, partial [Klebsiella pneumoniae]
ADRNRSHWSTSKTPSYTKSVSWQHHPASVLLILLAVVVWFTLPERKIRQLGKQRATPH